MFHPKVIADLITSIRGMLGLVLVWLGVSQGGQSLPLAIGILILCWSGDFSDGMIARLDRQPHRSVIGDHDIHIDLFVSICLGIYLIGAGFISLSIGIWYLIAWTVILWRLGSDKNLLMLIQAPIYLVFVLTALREAPNLGYWLVVWVLLATLILWRRFSREVVPHFIEEMRSLLHHDGRSR